MPGTDVEAVAIGAVLLTLFVLAWAAVDDWRPWARFSARVIAGSFLLVAPLSFIAYTDVAGAQEARDASPAELDRRAGAALSRGRLDEAEGLYKQALAVRERTLGRDHIDVARSLDNLASVYRRQGKQRQAEPLLRRALAIRQRVLGANHPEVARSRENLASLMREHAKNGGSESKEIRRAEPPKGPGVSKDGETVAGKAERPASKYRRYNYEKQPAAPPPPAGEERETRTFKYEAPPPEEGTYSAEPPQPPPPPPAATNGEPQPRKRELRRAEPPDEDAGEELSTDDSSGPMAPRSSPEPRASLDRPDEQPPPLDAAPAPSAASPEEEPDEPVARTAGAPPPEKDWHVVPIYYGTDRVEQPGPVRISYTDGRARKLRLGQVLVTVPKVHEVPNVEVPWVIKIPIIDVTIYAEKEDPKKHFTIKELKSLSREDFLRLVREQIGKSSTFKDHAVVFIHGYNTSFDYAAFRTAQMAYDLEFDGVPFFYSWPSGGALEDYPYDRESAEECTPYLREFLELVVKETGAKSVSVIAHSMGNLPLLRVLEDLKKAAPDEVVISQLILAAPDVSRGDFETLAQAIKGYADGVTMYAASNDRALTASHNFWRGPRAGEVTRDGPLVVPGIDTIDISAATTGILDLGHAGYATNSGLLTDIGKLIQTKLRPPHTRYDLLKRKLTRDGSQYWLYTPAK